MAFQIPELSGRGITSKIFNNIVRPINRFQGLVIEEQAREFVTGGLVIRPMMKSSGYTFSTDLTSSRARFETSIIEGAEEAADFSGKSFSRGLHANVMHTLINTDISKGGIALVGNINIPHIALKNNAGAKQDATIVAPVDTKMGTVVEMTSTFVNQIDSDYDAAINNVNSLFSSGNSLDTQKGLNMLASLPEGTKITFNVQQGSSSYISSGDYEYKIENSNDWSAPLNSKIRSIQLQEELELGRISIDTLGLMVLGKEGDGRIDKNAASEVLVSKLGVQETAQLLHPLSGNSMTIPETLGGGMSTLDVEDLKPLILIRLSLEGEFKSQVMD
ncbi:MAG: hypothetical protein KAI07_00675, partial [Deltaproteobacteria bacterium]|nr:hypothetical protein [Deltaproteobacteria bacterium]